VRLHGILEYGLSAHDCNRKIEKPGPEHDPPQFSREREPVLSLSIMIHPAEFYPTGG
jgi:hypothetical protein